MTEAQFFESQMELVFETQHNKRRGRDSIAYENNIIPLTMRAIKDRYNKELRINNNYAFLVSTPKWREIMATSFEGRKIDHEICRVVIPIAEKILSPYTYNNRKKKGSHAAINQVIENICNVSQCHTKPCRVIKLDFKGFFPNAMWNYAENLLKQTIDNANITAEEKNYLKWLVMIAIHCNPAANCTLRTPWYMWNEHIEPDKSLFHKPEGVGAAIGRLIWQTAMGLYVNDIICWLNDYCLIPTVCFVDDVVMVVEEERHNYALALFPELRRRLAERNIRLNEKKFYDQPYQNGLEFLGFHVKLFRLHTNNSTFNRAVERIKALNSSRWKDIDAMLSVFNSYSGMLKNKADYNRLIKLKGLISDEWWQWLIYDKTRRCLAYKDGYSVNQRLNKKYNLKLKRYENRRNQKAAQRAAHGNCECKEQSQRHGLYCHSCEGTGTNTHTGV